MGVLEHRGLGVGAEHVLQRVDDLTFAGVNPRGVQEVRHQVLGLVGRGLLQRRQRALDLGAFALGADGLDAPDLLALQRRVDAQDRRLGVVALGVLGATLISFRGRQKKA